MNTEYGKCCRCGEEIGPPYDRETDWLCKQCYDDTHKVRRRRTPRWGGRWLDTPYGREQAQKEQEEIDERIDREMRDEDEGAGVRAKLPKKPLIGAGHAKADTDFTD